jgi:UDP-glucuronate decarboxylase
VDRIWHLACPASPIHYQFNPVKTAKTSFLGTYNMLGLARRVGARLLLASTSEVYGDPEVHPQTESYWGSVNPIGVRSCYDEGKRIAETLCSDYKRMNDLDIRIARIFNTYGPRMAIDDGRVISNFLAQALRSNSLTIYGSGAQTRSFCYVSDLITGLIALMDSSYDKPVNLGNPGELSINNIAELIRSMVNPDITFSYRPLPEDDPVRRCPSIELAQKYLRWLPQVSIQKGLRLTLDYYKKTLLF